MAARLLKAYSAKEKKRYKNMFGGEAGAPPAGSDNSKDSSEDCNKESSKDISSDSSSGDGGDSAQQE